MASDAQFVATGVWHAAGSSYAHPARLHARGSMLVVVLEDGLERGPAADVSAVEISHRIGRTPRRLAFSNGSLFETEDNDAIDLYLSAAGHKNRWSRVHAIEGFHPRLILFVALVALFVAGIYRYAIPALVEVAVVATPDFVPAMMSQGTLKTLDETVFSASTLPPERQKALADEFARIAALTPRGEKGYALNFRDGGVIGPNAFALPDGTLVITDQLVALAGTDDEMILGVLAHEIGHVEREHSLRQLYRIAGTTGLIMLIAGDVGSGVEDVMTNGAALLTLSYSRDAESQADRYSAWLMLRAGHDPAAISRFFALIQEKFGDTSKTSMLSTHPGTPERRREIEDYATLLKSKTNPPAP